MLIKTVFTKVIKSLVDGEEIEIRKELNINPSNGIIHNENKIVVGDITDYTRLYNELYDCDYIEFYLVNHYYNINIELTDKQVVELFDSLNIHGVSL